MDSKESIEYALHYLDIYRRLEREDMVYIEEFQDSALRWYQFGSYDDLEYMISCELSP